MAWTTPTTRTTSTLITASIWNTDLVDNLVYLKGQADLYKIVRKASDESLNSSTTLQNDDALLFSVAANERWLVNLYLLVQAAANAGTMDFKCGWSYPTSTTMFWAPNGSYTTAEPSWVGGGLTGASLDLLTQTESIGVGLSANSPDVNGLTISAIVRVAGTAGTLNFQWAQNTSNGSNLTVMADSVLIARKLA
jgi:hypothetical protein